MAVRDALIDLVNVKMPFDYIHDVSKLDHKALRDRARIIAMYAINNWIHEHAPGWGEERTRVHIARGR